MQIRPFSVVMMYRIVFRTLLAPLLALLASAALTGADFVIVVDTSGSMTQKISRRDKRIRITTVQQALRTWLQALPSESRLTLISFNSGIQSKREVIFQNPGDRQQALQWVEEQDEEAKRNGNTHLWTTLHQALTIAADYAQQSSGRTVQVRVLTDGKDTERITTFEQVLRNFPIVDGKSIQGNLVILGDLAMNIKPRPGFRITKDPHFEVLFPPIILLSPKDIRVGEEMQAADNAQSIYQRYLWHVDGQAVATNKVLRHTFDTPGEHTVSLEVKGARSGQEQSQIIFRVFELDHPPPLRPEFIFEPRQPQPNQTVRFYGRSSGYPAAYKWTLDGAVQTAATRDFEWTPLIEGQFTVAFSVQDENGTWMDSFQTVHVREPVSVVAFQAPAEAGHQQAVQFANESQGDFISFRWDFGDGAASTERSPRHRFANPGREPKHFDIRLEGVLASGKKVHSSAHRLTVRPLITEPPPNAAIGFAAADLENGRSGEEPVIQARQKIRFLDESTGAIESWQWDFNGEGTSTERHPEFAFSEPGKKTIALTIRGPGGTSTATLSIAVPSPNAGWFRLWMVPLAALLLLIASAGKKLLSSAGIAVPPEAAMRVELSETASPEDSGADENLKPLQTFTLEMNDRICLNREEAEDAGDLVYDIGAKNCFLLRQPKGLLLCQPNADSVLLKSSGSVSVLSDFGAKRTLNVNISEGIKPEIF